MKLMEISNSCEDWQWEDDIDYLDSILKELPFKQGFMEIKNGGWRGQHGISPVFEINADNILSKLGDYDWHLVFEKEDNHIVITRYSHDEPMGATILLKPKSEYETVHKEIFN